MVGYVSGLFIQVSGNCPSELRTCDLSVLSRIFYRRTTVRAIHTFIALFRAWIVPVNHPKTKRQRLLDPYNYILNQGHQKMVIGTLEKNHNRNPNLTLILIHRHGTEHQALHGPQNLSFCTMKVKARTAEIRGMLPIRH